MNFSFKIIRRKWQHSYIGHYARVKRRDYGGYVEVSRVVGGFENE